MGKVLSTFKNGLPGAISRSIDDIVEAWKNTGANPIEFGMPVFRDAANGGVKGFSEFTTAPAAEDFVGFTVRSGVKSPETYGSNVAHYNSGEVMDVLVRGCVVASMANNAALFSQVYLRLSDGKLTGQAGDSGSTIALPGVAVRQRRDSDGMAEFVLKQRTA